MKIPPLWKKTLVQNEIRTYIQPFSASWTVASGDVAVYDEDGNDVTSTLVETVDNTASSVSFQTKPDAPIGSYTVVVIGTMTNEDVVDAVGSLTIVTEA